MHEHSVIANAQMNLIPKKGMQGMQVPDTLAGDQVGTSRAILKQFLVPF